MKLLFSSLCVLSVVQRASQAQASSAVTICPKASSIAEGAKYHEPDHEGACANDLRYAATRHIEYNRLKQIGGAMAVPPQKTVSCPANGAAVQLNSATANDAAIMDTGLDTVWFVENTSSTPIVVARRRRDAESGMELEVSAMDDSIYPATADPRAILTPGRHLAVGALEGHDFVVRQVLPTGVAGNVLLQHRAGLLPVGESLASADTAALCPMPDVEPIVNETTAPPFARTEPAPRIPCHTLDLGFRNVAACPLHGYYVRSTQNQNAEEASSTSCQEDFKFHLGVEPIRSGGDFMWDWKSSTKYEGTFVGHTFHFRLAADPTVLVDAVTVRPTLVTDCPTSSVAEASVGNAVMDAAGVAHPLRDGSNATHSDDALWASSLSSNQTSSHAASTAHGTM